MEETARRHEALDQYDLQNPQKTFIRHNENITYKVTANDAAFLLRIHQPVEGFSLGLLDAEGLSKKEQAEGEIEILLHLQRRGFLAQRPVPNKQGGYTTQLADGALATLLTWISGETLDPAQMTDQTGFDLGAMMGKLHHALEDLPDLRASRFHYDVNLILRMKDEMATACLRQHISPEDELAIQKSLDMIREAMEELCNERGSTGYVHADLSNANIIVSKEGLVPIDFSLSGYGYRQMELGMAFSQHEGADLHRRILSGYLEETGICASPRQIQPFYALSVLLFIACQHGRFYQEGWFVGAMTRWRQTILEPLNEGKQFVMTDGM